MFLSLPVFLRLINENIDNLPGDDGTRLISESSHKRINISAWLIAIGHDVINQHPDRPTSTLGPRGPCCSVYVKPVHFCLTFIFFFMVICH